MHKSIATNIKLTIGQTAIAVAIVCIITFFAIGCDTIAASRWCAVYIAAIAALVISIIAKLI